MFKWEHEALSLYSLLNSLPAFMSIQAFTRSLQRFYLQYLSNEDSLPNWSSVIKKNLFSDKLIKNTNNMDTLINDTKP